MRATCPNCRYYINLEPYKVYSHPLYCDKCDAILLIHNDESNQGTKYDSGKLRYDLIPHESLEELVKVYTFGCKKYEDENWRKGLAFKRIFAALMRHAWAWMKGEDKDYESGLHPLAHAAWCCFTIIWYEKYHKEFDDRWREK